MPNSNKLEFFWFLPTSGDGPYLEIGRAHV